MPDGTQGPVASDKIVVPPEAPIPLSDVDEGRRVTVRAVYGGHRLVARLAAMGLMPGAGIVVLRNAGGPFLLAVKGSRIAVGRGMAHKILVT
jgi:Fe2+ transport system protein FeoA